MTLEQEINLLIEEYNSAWDLAEDGTMHQYSLIENWKWEMWNENDYLDTMAPPLLVRVREIIRRAPVVECLSSPCPYIRGYKLLLERTS